MIDTAQQTLDQFERHLAISPECMFRKSVAGSTYQLEKKLVVNHENFN